jgi:hypothetical protein
MRLLVGLAVTASCFGQWLQYPTAGVPRLPDGSVNYNAPPPKLASGEPDLSGLWSAGQTRVVGQGTDFSNAAGQNLRSVFFDAAWGVEGGVPYQPWAAELVRRRKAEWGRDTPETHCLPNSILQKDGGPGAIHAKKFVHTPGLLIMLYERNVEYRQIFLDGRPLPADPNPSWNGYSTGRWDGDTLVVETNGFRDETWLDFYGSPLTEAGKVTERIRRPTYGQLEIELTLDDPRAYTRPWTVRIDQYLAVDTELLEYVCLENERDMAHLRRN